MYDTYDMHTVLFNSYALTMCNFLHMTQFVSYCRICNANYTIPKTMDMSVKKVIF